MKTNSVRPEVYVAVGKNRKKVYGTNTVYLENKQAFELEFFNPTSDNIMAKISINGKLISNKGLILRVGQRGYLERHIDEDRKFLFETYEVDGESKAVQKAIENNGDIKIEFFREKQCPPTVTYNSFTTYYPYYPRDWSSPSPYDFKTTCTTNGGTAGVNSVSCSASEAANSINFNSVDHAPDCLSRSFAPRAKKSIETGRVEKGSASGQRFNEIDMRFEDCAFFTVYYKLIPASQKPVEFKDLKLRCKGCGAKLKERWIACPVCAKPINNEPRCPKCDADIEPKWVVCPLCGEPLK